MFPRYCAFVGLFTAAKELKRTLSFEVELDIGWSCCLREDVIMPQLATPRLRIGMWKCFYKPSNNAKRCSHGAVRGWGTWSAHAVL